MPANVPAEVGILRGMPAGAYGGRLLTTSLASLSLSHYYEYLPLYRLESEPNVKSHMENVPAKSR